MDRTVAMGLLPEAYARALVLRGEGHDHVLIARQLRMPVEAVPLLLRVAEAKLAHLVARDPDRDGADATTARRGG